MLNEPLYQLGDSFTLTGLDLIEENGNLTYIYSEDPGFISEQYIYDPFSADSVYSENYSYSSSDGETVDYIYSAYRNTTFDSAGRLTERESSNSSNYIEFGSEIESSSSTTTSYTYANNTTYEIDFATSITTSTYNGVVTHINEVLFEYSYLEEPSDINDYYQRRTSGTVDNNADSVIDFTYYNLETVTDTSYDLVSVSFDSTSQQVGSFSSSYSLGDFGSYTTEELQARDSDGDGLIDYSCQSNSAYVYAPVNNSVNYLVSSDYQQTIKQDDDFDGITDYYVKTKRTTTESSSKEVEITWESFENEPGLLTIGISKDFNGDQTYDLSREFSFRFGAPSPWLDLGGHVADIDDTLL